VVPQHTPEHLAKQTHIVSQRLVRIETHSEILSVFAGSTKQDPASVRRAGPALWTRRTD
jgi:hypothetical protein